MARPRTKDRNLPVNCYHKHGAYYYVRAGKWHRLGATLPEAMTAYAHIVGSTEHTLPRHHAARLKQSRRWYWGRDLSQEPKYLAQAVATPCVCSCWMCRPRKHAGDTMQERKAMLNCD